MRTSLQILPLFLSACTIIPGSAVAQVQPQRGNARQFVWLLDNSDADFKKPPFEDSITAFDASGHVIRKMNVSNIAQTVGGNRAIALSSDGLFAVVAENVRDVLTCYRFPGEKVWSLSNEVIAVDISERGKVYALTSGGKIHGEQLLELSLEDGSQSAQLEIGGFDLAVDDRRETVWIVGADIRKLNCRNMKVDFQLDPIGWCAVSVDVSKDGSAWVAEREHPQVQGSRKRILKISSTGKILKSIDLVQDPRCLAIDRRNDLVWVTSGPSLLVYDGDGRVVREVESGRCWTVRVRQFDQTVWAATRSGQVLQYDHLGRELSRIGGFSGDQKYVAVPSGGRQVLDQDR